MTPSTMPRSGAPAAIEVPAGPARARSLHPAAGYAAAMLDQCRGLIASLTDADYAAPSRAIAGSSVGQHVRHSLDHFSAALAALDGDPIDYDHRARATPIETDRAAALDLIADLRRRLDTVDDHAADSAVAVRVMLSSAGDEAELRSTLAREVAFAAHHAVHHHAMMAAIVAERGGAAPAGFGKAPSTLHHERGPTAR